MIVSGIIRINTESKIEASICREVIEEVLYGDWEVESTKFSPLQYSFSWDSNHLYDADKITEIVTDLNIKINQAIYSENWEFYFEEFLEAEITEG